MDESASTLRCPSCGKTAEELAGASGHKLDAETPQAFFDGGYQCADGQPVHDTSHETIKAAANIKFLDDFRDNFNSKLDKMLFGDGQPPLPPLHTGPCGYAATGYGRDASVAGDGRT